MDRPIIFINMDNTPKFCDNRCNNKSCKKHISKLTGYYGGAVISKLRNMAECEGYMSKWKRSHAEIEQIKKEMREAGIT